MLGTIIGDIVGSIYEVKNIKSKEFELFSKNSRFTDDTVMSCAISKASLQYMQDKDENVFRENCIKYMKSFGRKYINAGYGGRFISWILSTSIEPYNSYGNGSAMRVSSIPYVCETLEETEKIAEISASVTHNHFHGMQGAKAVAGAIWILNNGGSKEDVEKYVSDNYYDMNFMIDDIKDDYKFDVSCQGSVPQAIKCFLESIGFEDSIRLAISLGGDSDTIAAITGSLSEAYYDIPEKIIDISKSYLDENLLNCVNEFYLLLNLNKKSL